MRDHRVHLVLGQPAQRLGGVGKQLLLFALVELMISEKRSIVPSRRAMCSVSPWTRRWASGWSGVTGRFRATVRPRRTEAAAAANAASPKGADSGTTWELLVQSCRIGRQIRLKGTANRTGE